MPEVNHNKKHKRILDAAVKIFAKKGFHNSRIAEVASEAGVASGTIYLYFKNKDDILIKVFEESLEKLIDDVNVELESIESPEKQLKRFIQLHLSMMKNNKELAEVLQVELRQSHKFMKEYEPNHWIKYLNIIASILKEGQKKGVFDPDISLGIFKRAMFGALDEISLHWIITNKDEKYLIKAADQLSDLILSGLQCRNGQ
jgi:TetR/AcrR family transcriptional regulator, fatty acid metabolism regulator protein